MKWLLVLLIVFTSCTEQSGQPAPRPILIPKDSNIIRTDSTNPFAPIDISPMDMSYFPSDYPVKKMAGKTTGLPVARVIYSRPHRQGRKIFGALLKYGEPWRLGANEATEIEFFKSVSIQNKKIPKGKYVLYAIPQADKWTIVFNTNLNSWGLKPEPKDDVFKFDIPVTNTDRPIEYFSMVFQKTDKGTDLVMAWDTVVARLPIQF